MARHRALARPPPRCRASQARRAGLARLLELDRGTEAPAERWASTGSRTRLVCVGRSSQSGGSVIPGVSRAELLARWQESGDRDALERLLQQEICAIKRRIRREVRHRTSPSQSASDVAQEAAARFLGTSTSPHFQSPAALRAYLWTAALNLLRRRMVEAQHFTPAPEARTFGAVLTRDEGGEELLERERSMALHLALQLLRPDERVILELVYFQGHDPQDAARRLGIEPENARMRLTRARRALTVKLRAWKDLVEGP